MQVNLLRLLAEGFNAPGLTLCGEVPKQAYIDWEGTLAFDTASAKQAEPRNETATLHSVHQLHLGQLGKHCLFMIFALLPPDALQRLNLSRRRLRGQVMAFREVLSTS